MASDKTERNELDRIGAIPVKNSGRGKHAKGDGIIDKYEVLRLTVDVKEYEKGFKVTPKNWAKVNTDAKTNQSDPALFLVLGDEEPRTRVVVISEEMFLLLMEAWSDGQ